MTIEYAFDSGTELGHQQLSCIEELLDGPTQHFIGAVTAKPGQRCLDLGAGNGTLSRWLAERTAPTGEVLAVDTDTTYLDVPDGVAVFRRDINDGLPAEGPFDVIVARLLLMHLERRKEILAELADALAPGGWLIVGDVTAPAPRVVAAASQSDAEFFCHLLSTATDKVGRPAGIDPDWGYAIDAQMTAAGLCNVDTMEFTHTSPGGGAGCLLYSNYVQQADGPMRDVGYTVGELARFHRLMRDPRFRTWFYPFWCTRGQKPATS